MITKKKEWEHLPDYLFFEEGDYVVWYDGKHGVITEVNGQRTDTIEAHFRTSRTAEYFGYRAQLDNGTMLNDYCYTFELDKSKYRDEKIEKILK